MRALIINSVCGVKSTGRICIEIAEQLELQGYECKIAYGRENVPAQYKKYAVRIGNNIDVKMHALQTRIFDNTGFASKGSTLKFLKWAEAYNPDLVWLHNLHGYYINIEMLFDWIKKRPYMQIKWTLHDCWSFTGHCTHFTMVKCEKWKGKCMNCPQKREYPASYFMDRSEINYIKKKKLFTGIENLTLITPSKWLANLTRESFLAKYPVQVKNTLIDTNVFKPTPSDFKESHGLDNKKIILGVASVWGEKKGFNDFLKLAELLNENFVIVLVGVTKKQIKQFAQNMIGITRTNNPKELAMIYSAADVFFNPTYEDTYPTVNLEAKACGTEVVTYNTGGSVESVEPNRVVPQGDLDAVKEIIYRITNN